MSSADRAFLVATEVFVTTSGSRASVSVAPTRAAISAPSTSSLMITGLSSASSRPPNASSMESVTTDATFEPSGCKLVDSE